jgi:hypothetical protein
MRRHEGPSYVGSAFPRCSSQMEWCFLWSVSTVPARGWVGNCPFSTHWVIFENAALLSDYDLLEAANGVYFVVTQAIQHQYTLNNVWHEPL